MLKNLNSINLSLLKKFCHLLEHTLTSFNIIKMICINLQENKLVKKIIKSFKKCCKRYKKFMKILVTLFLSPLITLYIILLIKVKIPF